MVQVRFDGKSVILECYYLHYRGRFLTQNEFHQKTGNLILGDGSVQSVSVTGLHNQMLNGTNTTSVQNWCFPW